MASDLNTSNPAPLFRASKRRKLRQSGYSSARITSPSGTESNGTDLTSNSNPGECISDSDAPVALKHALRRRAPQRGHHLGIAMKPAHPAPIVIRRSSENARMQESVLAPIGNRFAAQSGQVAVSTNQHMTDFINNELVKHDPRSPETNGQSFSMHSPIAGASVPAERGKDDDNHLGGAQPESGLCTGGSVHDRLPAVQTRHQLQSQPSSPRRGRVGTTSQRLLSRSNCDSRRDELVEAVLKEHQVGLFDESACALDSIDTGQAATDDSLAAEFEREYLEARRNQNQPKKPPGPPMSSRDLTKGPKLGGSRSARAAMHAQDRAAAKKH